MSLQAISESVGSKWTNIATKAAGVKAKAVDLLVRSVAARVLVSVVFFGAGAYLAKLAYDNSKDFNTTVLKGQKGVLNKIKACGDRKVAKIAAQVIIATLFITFGTVVAFRPSFL